MEIKPNQQNQPLNETEIRAIISNALGQLNLTGKRVLAIIPDATRSAPIPLFFRIFTEYLLPRVKKLDFLIALGTHSPMSDESINKLVGITPGERQSKFAAIDFYNHEWDNPHVLKNIGEIQADEIEKISGGLMREKVTVALNRMIFDYDQLLVIGPTFPHEVVGFSGGNKYFFPGISGPEIIHFFHWLGAVITNPVINGTKNTPVRQVVDRAASFISVPRLFFSLVVCFDKLYGLFVGTPEDAWSRAADLSAKLHIVYKEKPFHKVLGIAPEMYDELWVGGKVMYKLEPVVADGGELIIYAPHISDVSLVHGKILNRIGYHVRDYYLSRMEQFRDIPRGLLAHSTHVKGVGRFENGVEKPRINVVLATGISEEHCQRINLGYRDPATIRPEDWENREAEGRLLVRKAGEMLYRLADGSVPGSE